MECGKDENNLGFPRCRQLRCEGTTNFGNRYHHKVVGDSPEICRGLDSHGFADLKRQLNWCVALTSLYQVDDPRRFHMGTPAEVASSLVRSWAVEPTSDRIIEDIEAFPRVLQKIIEHKGCVVLDEYLRTGRRYISIRGSECKNKPRMRQRKSTIALPPCHPDCLEALNLLSEKSAFEKYQTAGVEVVVEPLEDAEGNIVRPF